MTKPTLLQTILNRPSQTYALSEEEQYDSTQESEIPRIATEARGPSGSTTGTERQRYEEYNASWVDIQGPITHSTSSSHAQSSTPASTASSLTTPPQLPPKHTPLLDTLYDFGKSRNIIPARDSAQRPKNISAHVVSRSTNTAYYDHQDNDSDDGDNDSTHDIFYTPNSSPRASLASSVSVAMSLANGTPTPPLRKVSRRFLRGNGLTVESSPSYDKLNHSLRGFDDGHKSDLTALSPPSTNTKANPTGNSPVTTTTSTMVGNTVGVLPSTPSIRVAVPSTRTPSRSNSLNKGRQAPDTRSASGTVGPLGAGQGKGRAVATASMVSSGSSMSSNSLDGHSLFSDIMTDTTKTTTALPGTSGSIKSTTTPTATPTIQSRRIPTKSHTYNGLGIHSSPSGSTPASSNSKQYHQYQRNRQTSSVMMSMTAVLEAAEEDELYRSGEIRSDVDSAAWKARQLLKQHKNDSKKASAMSGYEAIARGAGRAPLTGVAKPRPRAATFQAFPGPSSEQTDRGREKRSLLTKHQPITSSPLSSSSKPASSSPAPASSSGMSSPAKSQYLQVPSPSRPRLGRRRSRSLGSESTPRSRRSDLSSSYGSPTPSSSDSLARSHSRSRSVTTAAGEIMTVPRSSGERPSKGTTGYTSLVLPRAPPPVDLQSNRNGFSNGGIGLAMGMGEGKVDLTINGMAQTTMASVEVVRGLGSVTGRKGLMGILPLNLPLVRRKTLPSKALFGRGGRPDEPVESSSKGEHTPGMSTACESGDTSVLGFTSYRKPPEYVPSGSVLVQVWAVGVDGVDGRLVGVKMVHGGGTSVPPSPVAGTAGVDQDQAGVLNGESKTIQDEGIELEQGTEDIQPGKREIMNGRGGGLGRSLSLRERLARSVSLGRSAGKDFVRQHKQRERPHDEQQIQPGLPPPPQIEKQEKQEKSPTSTVPGVGYIPGRSFVGRVVECGWEVRGEVIRKGEWVAGLLDIKKCGALTEFIVVDRHRVHRVPHPKFSSLNTPLPSPELPSSPDSPIQHSLTLEELALLPLCGIPAYRAVRTFIYAFSSMRDNVSLSSFGGTSDMTKTRPQGNPRAPLNFAAYGTMLSRLNLGDHENGRRRRALVLRGHDGIGAMATQILVLRGWRVCVHVPFIASPPNVPTTPAVADRFMEEVEERIRRWGAEEVIFDDGEVVGCDEGRGAVVRVVDGLREDGDVFDVVLDTVGGKEVREAAERLLRSPGRRMSSNGDVNGHGKNINGGTRGMGQFTTVVGDNPERAIPSAGDLFRAGIRSLKFGGGGGGASVGGHERASFENVNTQNGNGKSGRVGYAWVNTSQDVDWEGKDVGETIGSVVGLALEYGIKPWVGAEFETQSNLGVGARGTSSTFTPTPDRSSARVAGQVSSESWEGRRVVPFERAPDVFVNGGPLSSGGTVVVKIAA